MTPVVDIECPECGAVEAVQKVGVGTYECTECGTRFSPEDALPGKG